MSACETAFAQESFLFSTFQDRSLTQYCKDILEDIPGVKTMNGDESTQKMFIFEGELID